MSCMWCVHFRRDIETCLKLEGAAYLEAPGNCTLEPEWREVSGRHYCGQFAMEKPSFYERDTPLAQWWLAMKENPRIDKGHRQEIKRLKEANRKLRDKIKKNATQQV